VAGLSRSAAGHPGAARRWLWLCLGLGACAAVASRPASTPRPVSSAAPAEPPQTEAAVAAPVASDPAAPAPPVEPLAPLRDFSGEELERIARVQRYVARAARDHGVEANLINAIIWVESKFEATARGERGPRGLMQLMPRTGRLMARELRRKYQPHSADFNIQAGTHYFALMLAQFEGDEALALTAYNRGPAVVQRWLDAGEPIGPERLGYAERVQNARVAFGERCQPGSAAGSSSLRCRDSSTSKKPSSSRWEATQLSASTSPATGVSSASDRPSPSTSP
jgi:SLT domain-containing protein